MKIDIAKSELQPLRREVHNRLFELRQTPAAKSDDPAWRAVVSNEIAILEKFIRKLNQALKAAYGHDCGGQFYK
jgi:cob(I)alamin adenosyltransferase